MLIDKKFWYDLETKQEKHFLDFQVIGSMGPPSTGKNTISARFFRHFFNLYIVPFDYSSMSVIYSAILSWHFTG
jgi:dynein heavy chain